MAVLVRITATGLDAATYDQIAANLVPAVRKQPGFVLHCGFQDA